MRRLLLVAAVVAGFGVVPAVARATLTDPSEYAQALCVGLQHALDIPGAYYTLTDWRCTPGVEQGTGTNRVQYYNVYVTASHGKVSRRLWFVVTPDGTPVTETVIKR